MNPFPPFPYALYDLPPPDSDADGIAHWGELWIHHGGFVATCGNATENLPRPLKQCAAWVRWELDNGTH